MQVKLDKEKELVRGYENKKVNNINMAQACAPTFRPNK
jgi:hypothetical protein